MSQLHAIPDELASSDESSSRRTSRVRLNVPRNSVLINYGTGNKNGSTDNFSLLRERRRSSRQSFPHGSRDRRLSRYENTFAIQPDHDHRVDPIRVRRVATSVIEPATVGFKYTAQGARELAESLAGQLRSQMKQLPFPRYKIVTHVSVGQKKGQDLRVASRCLWNIQWDHHITINKETPDAYVTVTMFFVYTE